MALSGRTTVTTSGTAVPLGTQRIDGSIMVKALVTNTNNIYIGNDGSDDIDSTNGWELEPGDVIIFGYIGNLGALYLDADTNGEGVAWIRLSNI